MASNVRTDPAFEAASPASYIFSYALLHGISKAVHLMYYNYFTPFFPF